jgi:hypothetical protein
MVPPFFGLNGNTRTSADGESAARGDSIRDSLRSEAVRFF